MEGLTGGFTVPANSNMTCYLRDRNQAGAIDGGLCVPDLVPDISQFCSDLAQSAVAKVVPVIYEARPSEAGCFLQALL